MQVAVLGRAALAFPDQACVAPLRYLEPKRRNGADAPDYGFIAAERQAVASLGPPDAAAGPNVYVVDALQFQVGSAPDVVVVVRSARIRESSFRESST